MSTLDLFKDPDGAPAVDAGAANAEPAAVGVSQCCGTCAHGAKPKHGFVRCGLQPWTMYAERTPCSMRPVQWQPLDTAKRARRDAQAGIDQAVAAADRSFKGWSDTAFAFIELFCSQNKGARVTGHDIVQASLVRGVIQPENSKAWGGPIQRASRAGLITRVGTTEDPNRHGNPIPLWEIAQ